MGNGVNNNNEFLKKLQETVMNQTWMKELYASNRADQQSKIKGVFTVVAENNVTSADRKKLEAQAETLQEKVERLEAKMAVLEEELAKNADKIEEEADKIVDLVTQAKNGSNKMEDVQKDVVKDATEDVFYELEQSGTVMGPDCVVTQIRTRIQNDHRLKKHQGKVEEILAELDGKQAQVEGLVANAEKWINQKNILKAQYGATKSTYDLLNLSIERIGVNEATYVNSDYDKSRPIYSPAKAETVSKFSENSSINTISTNTEYKAGTAPKTQEQIKKDYAQYLGTKATSGVDSNSYDNQAVKNLDAALDKGLFNDMISAGMSYDEVTTFLADNFSGANVKKTNGKFQFPYGHGSKADATFDQLLSELNRYNTTFKGTLNTWDMSQGNTIDSNAQIASLSENYSQIIDEFAGAGFTFKEAMFAMFNPDSGIFNNSGVVYNHLAQNDGERGLNYFIEFAGDDKTANMYKAMSDKIYDTWGVKPSRGADASQYESQDPDVPPSPEPEPSPSPSISQTDPIWFNLGDNKNDKFSFVIDRNQDGTINILDEQGKLDTANNEFVGGTGTSWLDDLKSLDKDGDNKLTGDELKELKILGTNYTDRESKTVNDEYVPNKGNSAKGFNRENETTIEYTLTNAQSMGIEEIDLNAIDPNSVGNMKQRQASDGSMVNVVDVNGSQIFNDNFTFKMKDGTEVTAHRQDETAEFMEKVYGAVDGKGYELGLKEQEVDDIMAKDYGEYDQFEESYGDVFANINILKNAGQLAQDSRAYYNETLDDIDDYTNVELIKAGNRAASMKNSSNWDSIKSQVKNEAAAAGVPYDEEQMKGIYVLDAKYANDARAVVQAYKEQLAHEDSLAQKEANRRSAWEAIILTAQEGVLTSAADIRAMIEEGKTPEDIVKILKEAKINQGVEYSVATVELGFDSEREKEIYTAFNNVFNAAGLDDNVVDALADLCVQQQEDRTYMIDRTGEELAQLALKKYKPATPQAE